MRYFYKIIILSILIFTAFYSNSFVELPTLIGTISADTVHTQFGLRIVPLGDQNNDGFDDFITGGFDFRAYLYYGGISFDSTTTFALRFDSVNASISNVGDINLDGYDDFTMLGRSPFDWKNNLYYGGPAIDTIRDAWFGDDTLKGEYFAVHTKDLNSNGTNEIICRNIDRKSFVIFEIEQIIDSIPDLEIYPANLNHFTGYAQFGDAIISGDFNGDGKDDLAVNLRPREQDSLNGQVYLYWGGALFDTIPDMIITRPGDFQRGYYNFGILLELLGDINNDGYDDFIIGSAVAFEDTLSFIYFGGPSIDTIPDIILTERITRVRSAGDLNSDGHNDIITSYPLSLSGPGHVNIYYGGDILDNIPDITIKNSDMPEWQQYFGNDCSGIGDVNNDGIDDFAFSAVDAFGRGKIYIFSGPGVSTNVEYDYEPNLPDNFELKQNYPNPFNPSTTIEFLLPQREYVTLIIYNSLGQKIKTLIDKELSVGSYSVEWDGKNESGNSVSTGVYLYKLETNEITVSKKMILIK